MHREAVLLAAMLLTASTASAQARTTVSARDTSCWSNGYAPCDGIGHAELSVRTRTRASQLRIVSVEARPDTATPSDPWQRVTSGFVLLVDGSRIDAADARLTPRRTHTVVTFFPELPVHGDARIRITLELDGRTIVVEATHTILVEHPDPEF